MVFEVVRLEEIMQGMSTSGEEKGVPEFND